MPYVIPAPEIDDADSHKTYTQFMSEVHRRIDEPDIAGSTKDKKQCHNDYEYFRRQVQMKGK